MTVQEIVNKVKRNGDTKKYRQILAELNDLPVTVINAVLDEGELPNGYSVINGEIHVKTGYKPLKPKPSKIKPKIEPKLEPKKIIEPKIEPKTDSNQAIEQELSKNRVRIQCLRESIEEQKDRIAFKEKELDLEKKVLQRLQMDLKTEEEIADVLKRME